MTHRKVAVLPDHIANKIAAGEVIQRPASVVKELLENALDAGSTRLVVSVKEGGRAFIQVSDDGAGMDEADAVASFLRHATSKIASYEDLEAIRTFGFRGEALASIGAVAQVSMKTRRAEDEVAVSIQVEGGKQLRLSREAREPGTTVTVQNLFYNVPARRKFLKSNSTEFRHIEDEVQRVAISNPAVALHFVNDDETVIKLKSGTLEDRLLDVFGQRKVESLIAVHETSELVNVRGYIGKPAFSQRTRQGQYLFLNNRYIVNRTVNHALFSAYEHLMEKGSFPFYLLFLEIDPRRVDVNVHPSKLEAKFEDEQAIYRIVASLTRRALAESGAIPSLTMQEGSDANAPLRFTSRQHSWPGEKDSSLWQFPDRGTVNGTTGEILPFSDRSGGAGIAARLFAPPLEESLFQGDPARLQVPPSGLRPDAEGATLIWQLHNKYILSQIKNGLLIVDQHVAHERILYERALDRFATSMRSTQQLLFPQTLELSAADYALMMELLPHFDLLGFDIKPFGKGTVVIEGVPPDARSGKEGRIVEEVLSLYKEYQQHAPTSVRDNLAKSYSCKSAVKAGDSLTEEEMRSLIDQLFATKMPYVCPHGRPIVVRISIDELDRRFGRTS